jgi:type VI secretion system protein ImpM
MATGIFGKIPSHGDFIDRNLPLEFRENWCHWLQHVLTVSREELQDQWLELYLNSQSWHFALSRGVIDDHAWAGVLIPSVDAVGRYFPLAIVHQLSNNNVFNIIQQDWWFGQLEAIAVSALDPSNTINTIEIALNILKESPSEEFSEDIENGTMRLLNARSIEDLTTFYLYSVSEIALHEKAVSIWNSSKNPENSFICNGLPCGNKFTKMLF